MGVSLVPGLGVAAAWRSTPPPAPRGGGPQPAALAPLGAVAASRVASRLAAPRSRAVARALPVDDELRRRAGLDAVAAERAAAPPVRGRSRARAPASRARSPEPRRDGPGRSVGSPSTIGFAPSGCSASSGPRAASAPPIAPAPPSALVRALALAGAASRRASERLIRAGRVSVNGSIERDPSVLVVAGRDAVALDDLPVALVGECGGGGGGRGRARAGRGLPESAAEYFEDAVIDDFVRARERKKLAGRGGEGARARGGATEGGGEGAGAPARPPPPATRTPPALPSRWLGASALSVLEDGPEADEAPPGAAAAGPGGRSVAGPAAVPPGRARSPSPPALFRAPAHVYFVLHKPKGFACTSSRGAEPQRMTLSLLDGWIERRRRAYAEVRAGRAGGRLPFLTVAFFSRVAPGVMLKIKLNRLEPFGRCRDFFSLTRRTRAKKEKKTPGVPVSPIRPFRFEGGGPPPAHPLPLTCFSPPVSPARPVFRLPFCVCSRSGGSTRRPLVFSSSPRTATGQTGAFDRAKSPRMGRVYRSEVLWKSTFRVAFRQARGMRLSRAPPLPLPFRSFLSAFFGSFRVRCRR